MANREMTCCDPITLSETDKTNNKNFLSYAPDSYFTDAPCPRCGCHYVNPYHFPNHYPERVYFRCTNPACDNKKRRKLGDVRVAKKIEIPGTVEYTEARASHV